MKCLIFRIATGFSFIIISEQDKAVADVNLAAWITFLKAKVIISPDGSKEAASVTRARQQARPGTW